jgi:hypothetical protein
MQIVADRMLALPKAAPMAAGRHMDKISLHRHQEPLGRFRYAWIDFPATLRVLACEKPVLE